MNRTIAALVLLVALAGACSSDKGGDATSRTSTTTTSDAVVTAATAPGSTLAAPPRTCSTEILRTSSSPPQQGAALADGQYFGFITTLDAEDLKLQFDVAQLLTGDAATKAAAEDGGESPPPNDYWIRNNTKAARTLALADDATICLPSSSDPTKNHSATLADLNKTTAAGEPVGVWVDVRSGTVERVEQQYFP